MEELIEYIGLTVGHLIDEGEVLKSYLEKKIDSRDWHGVADAAMDLRDIEAALDTLEDVLKKAKDGVTAVRTKIPDDAVLRALQVGQRAFMRTITETMQKTGLDPQENEEMRKTFLSAYSTGFLEGAELLIQIIKGNAATIIESDETVN